MDGILWNNLKILLILFGSLKRLFGAEQYVTAKLTVSVLISDNAGNAKNGT